MLTERPDDKAQHGAQLRSEPNELIGAQWIYASYHWLFVAVVAAVAAGPFIGEALLTVSVVAYAAGAWLMSPER